MANEIEVWNKVLTTAMQFPGVKVDRNSFLNEQLAFYCKSQQLNFALEKGTIGNINISVLDKVAKDCINAHTKRVVLISTAMGIPGGFAMLGTVPGDLFQYYYHVFVLAQKIAYIYGYPDLCDENGNFTESSANLLTVFVGLMGGVVVANKVIQEIAEQVQKEVLRRLPRYALTKGFIYPLIKQVAKWVGKSVTKQSFSKSVSKIAPVLGGIVSGGLTYATFKPQANKLRDNLKDAMILAYKNRTVEGEKQITEETQES